MKQFMRKVRAQPLLYGLAFVGAGRVVHDLMDMLVWALGIHG